MLRLTNDLLGSIANFLPDREVCLIGCVSRRMKSVSNSRAVWLQIMNRVPFSNILRNISSPHVSCFAELRQLSTVPFSRLVNINMDRYVPDLSLDQNSRIIHAVDIGPAADVGHTINVNKGGRITPALSMGQNPSIVHKIVFFLTPQEAAQMSRVDLLFHAVVCYHPRGAGEGIMLKQRVLAIQYLPHGMQIRHFGVRAQRSTRRCVQHPLYLGGIFMFGGMIFQKVGYVWQRLYFNGLCGMDQEQIVKYSKEFPLTYLVSMITPIGCSVLFVVSSIHAIEYNPIQSDWPMRCTRRVAEGIFRARLRARRPCRLLSESASTLLFQMRQKVRQAAQRLWNFFQPSHLD